MSYEKQRWENLPNQTTPITAERLNHMEDGIEEAYEHGGGAGDTLNIGAIIPFSGSTAPNGYMICDGTAISRTMYAELFSVIGTTFGDGDGSTTFNIPNLKGKVPVGLDGEDEDFNTLGETGGEKEHTLTIDEMPSHKHGISQSTGYYNLQGNKSGPHVSWSSTSSGQTPVAADATQNNGGGQAHNILQPYTVINYIIKVTEAQTGEVLSETLPVGTELDYDGNTVPSGWEQISDKEKILWTNPNPTSAISSATSVTLSSDDYDVLEVYYKLADNNERLGAQKSLKGYGFVLSETGPSGVSLRRLIDRVSDTSYTIATYSGGSTTTPEQYLIPIYIVGYKTGLFEEVENED